MGYLRWTGLSGKKYRFSLHPIGASFVAVPACYIFTKRNGNGRWSAVYIGETSDLSQRLENHHKMPCIHSHGATHICVNASGMTSARERLDVEKDLLAVNYAPCNR